jgi:cytoskeleton protein RodZ
MSVGERLRRARLDAGKTLDQVATETKIQLWILEAIERDDFSRVPGGVFIRGYLAAFARAVGVDPFEVWTAYAPETAQPSPAPPVPVSSPPPDPNESSSTPLWQYVVIVTMVLAAIVLWRNMTRGTAEVAVLRTPPPPPVSAPPTTVPAPAASAAVIPAPTPAAAPTQPTESGATATSGATPAPAPPEPREGETAATPPVPLVVQLHANAEVWIEASADGERKAYRLLMAGEDLRLDAQTEIKLLVGDASAVSYTINGMPARSLGGAGVVREISISPADYASLLAPPHT